MFSKGILVRLHGGFLDCDIVDVLLPLILEMKIEKNGIMF
jgi:hypothetical protein